MTVTRSTFRGSAGDDRIVTALRSHIGSRRGLVAGVDPRVADLAELLADFVLGGGKRLRPRFALAGWAAGRTEESAAPDEVVTACAALELIQACALIHDDIVDSSDTRRGQPTVHRSGEAMHRAQAWAGDSRRYGISQAILLGDLALTWADEMFVQSGIDVDMLQRAVEPWYSMKTEVLSGQMLDILAEASGATDEETPRRVNRFKTAAYTVERPLHIGAAMAGAPAATITALREFGVAVGQAFQLRDDVLGVFGDPAETGKPSGDDVREGKRTLLIARGIAQSSTTDSRFLLAQLGTDLDVTALARVRQVLVDSGAVASVEAEIDALMVRGLAALESGHISDHGQIQLRALAAAATRRRA